MEEIGRVVVTINGGAKAVAEVGTMWRNLQGQAYKHGVHWRLWEQRVAGGRHGVDAVMTVVALRH